MIALKTADFGSAKNIGSFTQYYSAIDLYFLHTSNQDTAEIGIIIFSINSSGRVGIFSLITSILINSHVSNIKKMFN